MENLSQLSPHQWHQFYHWMSARLVEMAQSASIQWEIAEQPQQQNSNVASRERARLIRQMQQELVRTSLSAYQ
jgi:NADH:ubiquinone oxidoreductase subunit